ncbi:hypothetical protein [Salinigranum salinum]|uniref:hypothetical protein n=1 Tax=Salinigranum salinum TaxID=1364937 RepID=UPI001260E417|nr:hypothetical protein [Salinigranum salinum]
MGTVPRLSDFHAAGVTAFRRLVLNTRLGQWYWRIAPSVHQSRRHLSPGHVDPPIDPFRLFFVDPDRITRFTGREFPVWKSRWADFGAVMDGDWDQRDYPPIHPSYRGSNISLYLAERFSETRLYRGLTDHFVDGVPWEDIDFVTELVGRVRSTETEVWQGFATAEGIYQYCHKLDRLYRNMRDQGCLSMRELNAREGRLMRFREVMENEILVDVSRTGELLFVTGRHRLSMAKILGLDRVPVAVVVRHPEWIAHDRWIPYTESGLDAGDQSDADSSVGEPLDEPW